LSGRTLGPDAFLGSMPLKTPQDGRGVARIGGLRPGFIGFSHQARIYNQPTGAQARP